MWMCINVEKIMKVDQELFPVNSVVRYSDGEHPCSDMRKISMVKKDLVVTSATKSLWQVVNCHIIPNTHILQSIVTFVAKQSEVNMILNGIKHLCIMMILLGFVQLVPRRKSSFLKSNLIDTWLKVIQYYRDRNTKLINSLPWHIVAIRLSETTKRFFFSFYLQMMERRYLWKQVHIDRGGHTYLLLEASFGTICTCFWGKLSIYFKE